MSGVQSFINGRQPGQQGSPRQASASLFKVPIPSTKLAQSELRSTNSRSAHNFLNGRPSAGQNSPLRGSKAAQPLTGHRDGFDTDAESLEDTTIMSIGDDSRNRNQLCSNVTQPQSNGFDSRFRLAYGNGREQRPNAQRLDQLEAEDPAIEGEGEAESYEGSGDEEGDEDVENGEGSEEGEEAEEGEEGKEQLFSDAGLMQQVNDPEVRRYREGTPGFRHARYQEMLASASPSIRNMVLGNPQNFQMPVNPLPSRSRCRESSAAESDGNQVSSDQVRIQRPTQQLQPNALQNCQLPSVQQPVTFAQPAAPDGKRADQHQSTRPPPTTQNQQPPFAPNVSPIDRSHAIRGANADFAINGSGGKMSPPEQRKNNTGLDSPGAFAMNGAQLHSGDEKAMPIPDGDSFPQFSSPQDEVVNELDSIASFEGSKTRKRARDLDYSLDQLSRMTFEQLRSEPFDHDPGAKEPVLPQEVANGTLGEKLDHMLSLKGNDTKAIRQWTVFASLPIEQYEDCGDLIIEKFTGIIAKFKDARQQRRKVVREFEEEVAKREERVRGKTSAVEKDLGRLKRGGEEVVRGKAPSS